MKERKWNKGTLGIHAGYSPEPTTGAKAVPIYQSASFVFRDTQEAADLFALKKFGNIYTRLMNPTTDALEKRLAALDGGTSAVAAASGMSAITLTVLGLASAGDEVVAASSLYGGTFTLLHYTLRKQGIKTVFVDPSEPENFRKAITPKTRLVYAETIGNPRLDAVDISAVADIAHDNGIPLVIDNTVAPYLVSPVDHGADIVVYSATKYIGGAGTTIGGVIVDSGNFDWAASGKFPQITEDDPSYHGLNFWDAFGNVPGMGNISFAVKVRVSLLRDIGACLSPFNAFLFLQGLQTLHLRMQRHSENALEVARFLRDHEKVEWVSYPGLSEHPQHDVAERYFRDGWYSGLVGFGVKGGFEAGKRFIEALELFTHTPNIGEARSLAIHPSSTTHQQLSRKEQEAAGVTEDFIRLSVGIEDVGDIIADLDRALSESQG